MRFIKSFFLIGLVVGAAWFDSSRAAGREIVPLRENWKFHAGEVIDGMAKNFFDGSWQFVSLPHCWGFEDAQQGKKFYLGPAWYRCCLTVRPESGKRYFLRFGAASTLADVWLNGVCLGQHRGGFGAFCFEITTNLSTVGSNLLAVRVSNAPAPDIAPLSGDFNVYGGLYRPVQLIETETECFALTDHASSGVAWLPSAVATTQAVLRVTAQISNGSRHSRALKLVTELLSADGIVAAQTNAIIQLAPGQTAPYWTTLVVPNPHLWNGLADPYLYRAIVKLETTNGVLVDAVPQSLGLRYYAVDPDRGFLLNGQPYPIYGVCRHQDRYNKGWAISEADMEEDVALIHALGATAVRCAHYQHSDYFYSLCDRAGLLVWAEIPQVNDIENIPNFEETSRNQLLDLIRQNINHPSIFAWSLFNEIGNGHTQDPHRELQNLNLLAHGEDPSRLTAGATCTRKFPQMNRVPDLLGWNIYPGWYGGTNSLTNFDSWLEEHRYDSRNGGFCLSEYGAGANIRQHESRPQQPHPTGPWHPEEWQAIVHEQDWAAIKSHRFVWGSFIWNMFDFCVADRNEGSQPGLNDKGLVSFDRRIKKDAYFFYQANWSKTPMVYITGRRFGERTNAVTDIKVYSNARTVALTVNGISRGHCDAANNQVFLWRDVRLDHVGTNHVVAQAQFEGQELRDECDINFAP